MDTPWKSHVDSMAKTLVKTRKRVKPKVEVEIRNETLDSKDNKVNKDSKTKTGSGKSLTSPNIKMNTNKKNDTFNESKKEKEITVTQVEKHTKPKTDPMIDTIRKEKEIEKKTKNTTVTKTQRNSGRGRHSTQADEKITGRNEV